MQFAFLSEFLNNFLVSILSSWSVRQNSYLPVHISQNKSDRLIDRIYKSNQKIKKKSKQIGSVYKQNFQTKEYKWQVSNENCAESIDNRELQVKNALRLHLALIRMVIIDRLNDKQLSRM